METTKDNRPVAPEENYPSPVPEEIIEEKNDKPAANVIKWVIIIAVILLAIIYFVMFYDRDMVSSVE